MWIQTFHKTPYVSPVDGQTLHFFYHGWKLVFRALVLLCVFFRNPYISPAKMQFKLKCNTLSIQFLPQFTQMTTENDMHGGWVQSNHSLLLFLFPKDNKTISRKHTVNLLCLPNLLFQVYEHKSSITSGDFLRSTGLGACVQNDKPDANNPQGGSQRAREASLALRLLPGTGLSTSLCSILLFSLYTLWCLKISKPKTWILFCLQECFWEMQ